MNVFDTRARRPWFGVRAFAAFAAFTAFDGRRALASSVGLAALLLAGPAVAGTVYRWTDDQGRTHYSEVVPEKYQKTAKPVSPGPAGPTPAQQQEAQERAARDKARAAQIEGSPPKAQAGAPPAPASSAPVAKRPARIPDQQTDCDTWARLYKESIDCFAPYRTARGATREEAFAFCTPVDEPPTRCSKRIPER